MDNQTYKALHAGMSVKQLLWSSDYDLPTVCGVWAARRGFKILGMKWYNDQLEVGFKLPSGNTYFAFFNNSVGLERDTIELMDEKELLEILNPYL